MHTSLNCTNQIQRTYNLRKLQLYITKIAFCYITKVTFVNTFDLACPESVQDDDEKRQESEKSKMKAKQLDNIKPQGMKSQAGTNQICKLHKSMTEEIMKKKEQTGSYQLHDTGKN
uniref:Uncharacterized protein n=2 Tax=Oryza TaxID=4527 RepID=Q5ZA78_ORYSJ|nr:hypothetical protein [Oryza sativa Japonica Group]